MQWKMSDQKRVPYKWKKTDGSAGTATDETVTSSDENVAKAELKDGYVNITNVAPGACTISVSGDTDPGTGVKTVSKSFAIELLSDDSAADLEFGDAEDQPKA